MATRRAASAMQEIYPAHAGRIITIMNGCDETVIEHTGGDRFVIAYAGSIYLDRDPRPIFTAAARVVRELSLSPDQFGIEFMGRVQDYLGKNINQIASEEGIGAYLRVWPQGTRKEALAFLSRAQVLLSLPQDSNLAIPAKIFDYMQFEAWILALTEPGTATSEILEGTDSSAVPAHDTEGLTKVLRERYLDARRGIRPEALANVPRFTSRDQAEMFLAVIRQIPNARPELWRP